MIQHTSEQQKQDENQQKYEKTQMQREIVIQRLKEQGCRITKQRMVLLDIILNENCSSCKEIYYKASRIDPKIGTATVYRMINTLEEIGAISRKNMYRVECSDECARSDGCEIVLDDNTTYHLSLPKWNRVVQEGMKRCGYLKDQKVAAIRLQNGGIKTDQTD